MKSKMKLTKHIRIWGIIFIISLTLILFIGFEIVEYLDFRKKTNQLRENYIKEQKETIKLQVDTVIDNINQKREKIRASAKEKVRSEVYRAYETAENLYEKFKINKSREEIIEIIVEALRPVRFNNGRGYIFCNDLSGNALLYPTIPSYEGTSILDLQDNNGVFVVKKQNQICLEKGEGFVSGYWPKPNSSSGASYEKTSYIKYFEPLGIYFGAGVYLDEVEEIEKRESIEQLVDARFGERSENYFFGSTYDGDPLFSNGRITRGEQSVWDLTDPTGIKIIQEQREAVRNPEGGFLRYSWNKLDTEKLSPKISFTRGLDSWRWMIGAGIYLDDIEIEINKMQDDMRSRYINQMVILIIIATTTVIVFLLILNFFNSRINRDHNLFQAVLKKAVFSKELVDTSNIRFKEIEDLANNTNEILQDRNRKTFLIEMVHANIPNILWKANIDENGKFYDTYISETADDLLSLEKGTLNNNWDMYFSYVLPEYLPMIEEKFQYGISKPGQFVSFDYEVKKADGSTAWFSSKGRMQIENDVMTVFGSTIDISERKQIEEALKDSESRLETWIQNSPVCTKVVDLDLNLQFMSVSGVKELGIKNINELYGKPYPLYFYPESYKTLMKDNLKKAKETGEIITQEASLLDINGTELWYQTTIVPVYDEKQNLSYLLVVSMNTTERRNAEEQIRKNLKEKNLLIQEIFHRTKNNMAVICAMLSMESMRSGNDYVKEVFDDITLKIRSMALVHQKLYKAKDLSNINLKEYIEDLTDLIMQSYGVLSERVNINLDLQDVRILIDSAVPLGLIINELITNIFKHAFPEDLKGEIIIRLFEEDNKTINLFVIDNGVGFPENFDPRKDGSMGLVSVFSIAENQLKGEISVKSENGLTWHFKLADKKLKERV